MGSDESAGDECRIRLPDRFLEEAVISVEDVGSILGQDSKAKERLDGFKMFEIIRTGPVKHIGTAVIFVPGADTQAQLADLADELDPKVHRQSKIIAEDKVIEALVAEGLPQDRIERIGH